MLLLRILKGRDAFNYKLRTHYFYVFSKNNFNLNLNKEGQNNFMCSERNLGYESDNLIIYYAGPIKIEISGFTGLITLSCNNKWNYLLNQVLEVAKKAWKIENENLITVYQNNIEINYNF